MTYAIVYASKTGNTRLLAETIRESLPQDSCLWCGGPDERALAADRIYLGFWTDKGSCSQELTDFLAGTAGKEVFLFGTAGFGGAPEYFEQILARVAGCLPDSARLVGRFMCQGRMPQAVRDRYAAMEESPRRAMMLENFDRALPHPNAGDLSALKAALPPL